MPDQPEAGTAFAQEEAPGANDLAAIISTTDTINLPGIGTFNNVLFIQECNAIEEPGCDPLEDGDPNRYVEDIGVVQDGPLVLIEFTVN